MNINFGSGQNFDDQASELSEERFTKLTREALLESFMSDHHIHAKKDSVVTFTLPEGESAITFLKNSQNLSQLLFNRPHVAPWQFERWLIDKNFNEVASTTRTLSIEGFSQEACLLTKEEQTQRGYANVHLTDLVLAHAAYFLATKEDLFARHVSRALEGDLSFYRAGLAENPSIYDKHRYQMVTGSRYLTRQR